MTARFSSRSRLLLVYAALLIAALVSSSVSRAQTVVQVVNPRRGGVWVSDRAHVLDASTEQRLNALLDRLERQSRAEMTVVTLRRAEGAASPKQFATRLFKRWGVGKRGTDNGVLVLLVMDARRIEVETGRGLESVLPANRIQTILQTRVVPRFKEDDYGGGVLAGVQSFAQIIARGGVSSGASSAQRAQRPQARTTGRQAVPAQTSAAPRSSLPADDFSAPDNRAPTVALVAGGAAVLVLLPFGAGALWRNRPRRCVQCGQPMRFLDEAEDDIHLAFGQRFEEGLGSVDYRVWRCDRCSTSRVERAAKWFSGYDDCPLCRHRTVYSHTDILRHPTYAWPGESLTTRACRFPGCPFCDSQRRILPVRQRPSQTTHRHYHGTSSGRSSGSSSGSSGGGNFGGGSSSGGGAGASW